MAKQITKFDENAGFIIDATGLVIISSYAGTGCRCSNGYNTGKRYFEVYCTNTKNLNIILDQGHTNLNTTGWPAANALLFSLFSTSYRVCYSSNYREFNWNRGGDNFNIGISIDFEKKEGSLYLNGKLVVTENYSKNIPNLNIFRLATCNGGTSNNLKSTWNFGASKFKYSIPTGFTSWDINDSKLYKKGNEVWGMSNSVFTKLTDDWDALSDTEKVALFVSTNYEIAAIDDLKKLGKFKVLMYSESDAQQILSLTAVPKNQLIISKGLINISKFESIDNIKITSNITASAKCKIIVTTDLTTYKTYDFTTKAWQDINHNDLDAIETQGIDATQLATIPSAAWNALVQTKNGLGFAYLLSQESTADTCTVDKLLLQADMKGSWDKSVYGTEYKYGYPANNVLSVKLLTSGDYKINYSGM